MSLTLDPTSLRAMRLHSQRIARSAVDTHTVDTHTVATGTAPSSPVAETVRTLLAIQAQDFAQAVWAVGLRTAGSTRSDVMTAFANGEVVRSAPMRGTLHFLAAADLRWILSLTAQRTLASERTRFAGLGLDDTTFERAAQVASVELAGGVALSREEFLAVLRRAGVSTEGQRGYHLIFQLSQRALVCWGPPRGNQQALVLVDEWIPPSPDMERSEALREFALRYFTGHGPATERDFAWWTKLTLADARSGIALARDALREFALEGETFWAADLSAADPRAADPPAADPTDPVLRGALREVSLLPGFDEYLLGYQDRSHVLAAEHVQQVIPGKNGIFLPTLVSAGAVVGTWRKGDASGSTSTNAQPFASFTVRETAALRRSDTAYARFMAG